MTPFRVGERLGILAIRGAGAALDRMPLERSQRFAHMVSRAYLSLGERRVRWALENLRIAFPSWSEAERRALALQSAENLLLNLIDLRRSERWSDLELMARFDFEGIEHLVAALEGGRGAVLISLHMGCYDLAARAFALRLPNTQFAVVAHRHGNPLLERWLNERRNTKDGTVERIATGAGAALRSLRVLRAGRPLILLSDLYMRSARQVEAPLFGRRCHTPSGPAQLARRAPAPILPCYVVRDGADHHHLRVLPELELADVPAEQSEQQITAACNAAIEGIIRKHPEQWNWGHRRFRHSPDVAPGTYRPPRRQRLGPAR